MKEKKDKILIVEDAKIWAQQLINEFEKRGIGYDWVIHGGYAVAKIREGRAYMGIIMDIEMPVLNGSEATKQIRKLGFTKPIIGHSSKYVKMPEPKDIVGMNRCIIKGTSLGPLMGALVELGVIDEA